MGGRTRIHSPPRRAGGPRRGERRHHRRLPPARPGLRGEPVRHRAHKGDSADLEARGLVGRLRLGGQPGGHQAPRRRDLKTDPEGPRPSVVGTGTAYPPASRSWGAAIHSGSQETQSTLPGIVADRCQAAPRRDLFGTGTAREDLAVHRDNLGTVFSSEIHLLGGLTGRGFLPPAKDARIGAGVEFSVWECDGGAPPGRRGEVGYWTAASGSSRSFFS